MSERIENGKFVELKYKVVDSKSGEVLLHIEYPVSYVHGANDILSKPVTAELEGKTAGQTIDVPIDCNTLYGPRDESLVITEFLENVPEEYQEIGTTISMENDAGDIKNFIVTRIDEKSITIDGNNPLSGREVIFKLDILTVREATDEEIELGGAVDAEPDLSKYLGKDGDAKSESDGGDDSSAGKVLH